MNIIETHLQGIGKVPAIMAQDLEPGQIVMWNYGYTSEVISVTETSKCFVLLTAKSRNDGKVYERKFKKSFLIAIRERFCFSPNPPPP